jgi:hypothetical protein
MEDQMQIALVTTPKKDQFLKVAIDTDATPGSEFMAGWLRSKLKKYRKKLTPAEAMWLLDAKPMEGKPTIIIEVLPFGLRAYSPFTREGEATSTLVQVGQTKPLPRDFMDLRSKPLPA